MITNVSTIRLLQQDDLPLFDAHFDRHRAESGRGEPHFMPFEANDPDGPNGLDRPSLSLSLSDIGWQRCFAAWHKGSSTIVGHVDLKGSGLKVGLHRSTT